MVSALETPHAASSTPPQYRPRSVRIGGWHIRELSDGFMRLDGGGMWGVVPRVMWQAWTPPADDHTILLALRPFLAQRDGLNVVIEGGVGGRWEPKWQRIYQFQPTTTLEQSLGACGVAPEEVTHVVLSHCHWDHIGALVVERGGELAPLFPNARHFAPANEIEIAQRPGHARAASYRADDVAPLLARGLLRGYPDVFEPLHGIRCHVLGGHSDGTSVITLGEDGREGAVFWGDVVPTTHHVQPPYIMAYDIDVARSFEVRSEWLERAAEREWVGLFYHDVDHAFGRVVRDGKRYAVASV